MEPDNNGRALDIPERGVPPTSNASFELRSHIAVCDVRVTVNTEGTFSLTKDASGVPTDVLYQGNKCIRVPELQPVITKSRYHPRYCSSIPDRGSPSISLKMTFSCFSGYYEYIVLEDGSASPSLNLRLWQSGGLCYNKIARNPGDGGRMEARGLAGLPLRACCVLNASDGEVKR